MTFKLNKSTQKELTPQSNLENVQRGEDNQAFELEQRQRETNMPNELADRLRENVNTGSPLECCLPKISLEYRNDDLDSERLSDFDDVRPPRKSRKLRDNESETKFEMVTESESNTDKTIGLGNTRGKGIANLAATIGLGNIRGTGIANLAASTALIQSSIVQRRGQSSSVSQTQQHLDIGQPGPSANPRGEKQQDNAQAVALQSDGGLSSGRRSGTTVHVEVEVHRELDEDTEFEGNMAQAGDLSEAAIRESEREENSGGVRVQSAPETSLMAEQQIEMASDMDQVETDIETQDMAETSPPEPDTTPMEENEASSNQMDISDSPIGGESNPPEPFELDTNDLASEGESNK